MLVVNWMSTKLVSVGPEDSMSQASQLMRDYNISHLPVIKNGALLGVVSDRDLKRASASDATSLAVHELSYLLSRVKIKDIMTPRPVTVDPHDTIEDAALLLLEHKISCLPVVDEGEQVMGMITKNDVFRAMVLMSGVTAGGIQFGLDLADEPGSIKRAADVIRKYGGRMVSIQSTFERAAPGRRRVFIRMKEIDRSQLAQLKEEIVGAGVLLYLSDSRERTKEVFEPGLDAPKDETYKPNLASA